MLGSASEVVISNVVVVVVLRTVSEDVVCCEAGDSDAVLLLDVSNKFCVQKTFKISFLLHT